MSIHYCRAETDKLYLRHIPNYIRNIYSFVKHNTCAASEVGNVPYGEDQKYIAKKQAARDEKSMIWMTNSDNMCRSPKGTTRTFCTSKCNI